MKQIIELDDGETKVTDELFHMLVGHPDVEETVRKRGYVDLRIKSAHWVKILHILIPEKENEQR